MRYNDGEIMANRICGKWILIAALLFGTMLGCGKEKPPKMSFLANSTNLSMLSSFDSQCTKQLGPPLLKGKYVLIDANYEVVDPAAAYLPADSMARDWSELDTLVLIRSTSEQVGVYKSSGLPALQWTSRVMIIDARKKLIIHVEDFLGGMPSKRALNEDTSTAQGQLPTDSIVSFLRSLPRS